MISYETVLLWLLVPALGILFVVILSTFLEWLYTQFVQTVEEDTVWLVTNRWGKKRLLVLTEGTYRKFWPNYTTADIMPASNLLSVGVWGKSFDDHKAVGIHATLTVIYGFSGTFSYEQKKALSVSLNEIGKRLTEVALTDIKTNSVFDYEDIKAPNKENWDSIVSLAQSKGLVIDGIAYQPFVITSEPLVE